MKDKIASVVLTHHIIAGRETHYEKWLENYILRIKNTEGFIDLQIVRPIPELTFFYTIIIRFNSVNQLQKWMDSTERNALIEQADEIFAKEKNDQVKYGLNYLFDNDIKNAPVRWKQYLVTWSAIYPLSLLVSFIELPFLRSLKIPDNRYFDILVSTACLVFLMVFLVMPFYTRQIRKWFYN